MPEVRITCDSNGWLITLTKDFQTIEADGHNLSEALYGLAEQVEMDEVFWSYLYEITGVEI